MRNNNNNTPDESPEGGGGDLVDTSPPSSASSPPTDPESSLPAPASFPGSRSAVTAGSGGTSIVTGAGTRTFTLTSISDDELSSFVTKSPENAESSEVEDSTDSSQPNDSSSEESQNEQHEFFKVLAKPDESDYIRAKEQAEKKLRQDLESKTKEQLVDLVNTFTKDINGWKKECAELSEQVQRLIRPSMSNKYPLALRIDVRENNYKYSYSRKDKTETYTAKYAFLFKLVRQHKTIIWHTLKKDLYANKVEIVNEEKANIYHVNGEVSEIEFDPEPEVFVIYLVEANVNVKHSTNELIYKYNKKKNREKFICRSGYLIDKIWRNEKVVWPPNVAEEEGKKSPDPVYSHKVVIEKLENSKPNMRVFFHESEEPQDDDDDETDPDYIIVPDPDNPENFKPSVPFPLPPDHPPVSPQVQTQPPSPLLTPDGKPGLKPEDYPPGLKLFGVDPSDSEKSILLTQYSLAVSILSEEVYNYDLSAEAKCNSVTFEDKTVWKYDPSEHGDKHPLKISYRYSRKVFVFLSVPFVFEKQADGEWQASQLSIGFFSLDTANPPNLVEINYSQYELRDNSANNEEFIFEFKAGVKCSEVRFRGNQVWRHNPTRFKDNFPKIVGFLKDKTIAIVIGELRILVNLAASRATTQTQQATPPAGGAQAGESAQTDKAQKEEGSDASVKPTEPGSTDTIEIVETKTEDAAKETQSEETAKAGPTKTFTLELDSDEEDGSGESSGDKAKSADGEDKKQGEEGKKASEAAGEVDASKQLTDEAKPETTPDDKVVKSQSAEAEKRTDQTPDLTVVDASASSTTPEHKAPGSPDASSSDSELEVVESKSSDKPSQDTASRTTSTKVEVDAPGAPPSADSDVSQTQGASATTPAQTPATIVHKTPEEQQHTPSTQPTSGTPVVTQPQTQVTPSLAVQTSDTVSEDDRRVVDNADAGTVGAQTPAQQPQATAAPSVLVPPLQPSYQSSGAQTGTAAGTAPTAQVSAPTQQQPTQAGAQPAGTAVYQQQQVAQQQPAQQAYVYVPYVTAQGTIAYGLMTLAQYQAALAAYQSSYAAQAGSSTHCCTTANRPYGRSTGSSSYRYTTANYPYSWSTGSSSHRCTTANRPYGRSTGSSSYRYTTANYPYSWSTGSSSHRCTTANRPYGRSTGSSSYRYTTANRPYGRSCIWNSAGSSDSTND
ncbi:hypothetical protein MACK_002309 [Theileria orientalis]|uniref:Uncharacterized protein n=1 Tax=Theileria orientalis TaxID=68886 RepID=A0A976MBF2_THEOR|nr:hypothetical protein MACK_002309 [Theileria orientalis]